MKPFTCIVNRVAADKLVGDLETIPVREMQLSYIQTTFTDIAHQKREH